MRMPTAATIARVSSERDHRQAVEEALSLSRRIPDLDLNDAVAVVDELDRIDLLVEVVRKAVRVDALGEADYGRQAVYMARADLARLPQKHTVHEEWPTTWKDHLLEDLGRWLLMRAYSRWAPVWVEKWGHRLRARAHWTTVEHDAYMFFTGIDLPPELMDGRFATFFTRPGLRRGPA